LIKLLAYKNCAILAHSSFAYDHNLRNVVKSHKMILFCLAVILTFSRLYFSTILAQVKVSLVMTNTKYLNNLFLIVV